MGFIIFLVALMAIALAILVPLNLRLSKARGEQKDKRTEERSKPDPHLKAEREEPRQERALVHETEEKPVAQDPDAAAEERGKIAVDVFTAEEEKAGDSAYRNALRQGLRKQAEPVKNEQETDSEEPITDQNYRETLRAMQRSDN